MLPAGPPFSMLTLSFRRVKKKIRRVRGAAPAVLVVSVESWVRSKPGGRAPRRRHTLLLALKSMQKRACHWRGARLRESLRVINTSFAVDFGMLILTGDKRGSRAMGLQRQDTQRQHSSRFPKNSVPEGAAKDQPPPVGDKSSAPLPHFPQCFLREAFCMTFISAIVPQVDNPPSQMK